MNFYTVGFILGGIAIVSIFSFPFVYDYFVYVIPLNTYNADKNYSHVDIIGSNFDTTNIILKSITPNDDTLIVEYKGGVKTQTFTMDDFSYTDKYFKNQSILITCHEYKGYTYLSFFNYLNHTLINDTNQFFVSHDSGLTLTSVPCDFPEIIKHTKNMR